VHQEKKKLRPELPDALDALDTSNATCLTRTQFAMAPCIQTQLATALCVRTQLATAYAYRTERVRAFSFWTQPCQGIFLLDAAVSGHFPSGRSHVRAFSFWTQPCQGIFLLDAAVSGQMASGRYVSWHRGHAGCQGTQHHSKYSCRIRKHAAGSRHSDSVQFYSFYLMYIYICYYHTLHGNKGKLANTTRRVEHDAVSTTP